MPSQVKACRTFFGKPIPNIEPLTKEFIPVNMQHYSGTFYDITGFDAKQVVLLLASIYNDKDQFTMNKTFYLLNRTKEGGKNYEEAFKLQARPTKNQPGNTIVFVRPKGKKKFTDPPKKFDELNGALEAEYVDASSFAKDIKQYFENNTQIEDRSQAINEAYIILLNEIARRLVKVDNPTEKKEEFDILPIPIAIAMTITLLEHGKCKLEDVFLPGEKYHCFSGPPEERAKKICNITEDYSKFTKEENVTEEDLLKKLEESFCSHKPQAKKAKQQDEKFNALTVPSDGNTLPVLFKLEQEPQAEKQKQQEEQLYVQLGVITITPSGNILPTVLFESVYSAFDYLNWDLK